MTDTSGPPILVAGATGRQGGSVVRHLLERQLTVRALVRDPQSGRAKALAGQGIEIAQGDMDDLASLQKAMAGVRGEADHGQPGRVAVLTCSDPPRPTNGWLLTSSTALSRSAASTIE
jgi:nucleoside-diphosphate-sugar epimerase